MRRVAFAFAFALALVACRDPTEMRVHVTTDLRCSGLHVAIALGAIEQVHGLPVSSTANACDASGSMNDVGTLVVTPAQGADEELGIEVVAGVGVTTDACKDENAPPDTKQHCIFARRALRFQAHTSLEVPVVLQRACIGVTCDDPHTTCDQGVCVSAAAACDTSGECLVPMGDGGPPDAGPPDAGPPPGKPGCPDWPSLARASSPMVGVCPGRRNQTAIVVGGGSTTNKPFGADTTGHVPPVTIADGRVAFLSTSGQLSLFDGEKRQLTKSMLPTNGGSEGATIARADGAVAFSSGTVIGFDDFAGNRTSIACAAPPCGEATIDKSGDLFVATNDGIVELSPALTQPRKIAAGNVMVAGASMSDSEILVGVAASGVFFASAKTGMLLDQVATQNPLGPAIVAPDTFESPAPKAYVFTVAGLSKLNPSIKGTEQFRGYAALPAICMPARFVMPAMTSKGVLLVPTCGPGRPAWIAIDGAFLVHDGTLDGPTLANDELDAPPTIDGAGHVFAITKSGLVIDQHGVRGAINPTPGAVFQSALVVRTDGGLVAADSMGGLHFLQL